MDLRTGKERWIRKPSDEYVTALGFSPDGKILASAGGFTPSPIRLWDVASGNVNGVLEGHSGYVCSLVFWPDGKTLGAGSSDQTIRLWNTEGLGSANTADTASRWANPSLIQVWDLQTRSLLRELAVSNSPPQIWLCMAQGNRLIIGDAASQSLHEWDLAMWQKVHTWPGPA